MKMKLIAPLLLTALLSPRLFAGWSEPVRLTYRGHEMNPQIIAIHDTVHVAWTQIADSEKVSYIRSVDGGQSWGEIINLSSWGHHGAFVDLSKNGGRLFAGWADYPPSGHANIGYSITLDGLNWSTPAFMLGNNSNFGNPIAATMSGDTIYGVYYSHSQDSTGNIPFRFIYSSDQGQTWSNEQTIAYAPSYYCNSLIINKCRGVLFVVWTAIPFPENTTWECQVVISRDGGQTWEPKTILSQNGGRPAQAACLSCNRLNGFVAVGWMDYSYPGFLYLRITGNLGYTWGPEIHAITSHYISDPNIDFVGDTLWATWKDGSFADNWQIGYSKSIDQGHNWSEIERISITTGTSMTPWLSYNHGKVHLVWQEESDSTGRDIYYRRWQSGDDINEITNPTSYSLLKSYPNPFNSTTKIMYKNIEGGEIWIYDIAGRLVKEFDVKDSREGAIEWEAIDNLGERISTGIYLAKARIQHGLITLKMIYLK